MSTHESDGYITLRVPRTAIALALAAMAHLAVLWAVRQLPEPRRPPQRIEVTLTSPPPPPPPQQSPADAAARPPARPGSPMRSLSKKLPSTPVVPEVDTPSPTAPQVAAAPRASEPQPPPTGSWRERTLDALAATRPAPPLSLGTLAPSPSALDRVAVADPRLFDERTEQRLMEDHGTFFRRGLEALRGHWHPDDVLRLTERDPLKRCGRTNRTTFAVAVLDKAGNVVDVDLKAPSGCPELDVEAMAAFRRVARFPNPPAGIFVAPDGTPLETARYPVRFIVTFDGGLQIDWRG